MSPSGAYRRSLLDGIRREPAHDLPDAAELGQPHDRRPRDTGDHRFRGTGDSQPQAGTASVDQVPTAIVTANYPGVSPQIIADDVSTPLERALTGVSGVTKVQSTSSNGIATITVEWEYGLDPDKVVADIRNAVDGIKPTLPDQVETDVITGRTDDIPVLLLAVASDAPLDQAGRRVENIAVPELSGIDGVRSVTVTGENTTQLLVTPAATRPS